VLLERVTTIPLDGAGPANVTVPRVESPPRRTEGSTAIDVSDVSAVAPDVTFSTAVRVWPPVEALMVIAVAMLTVCVEMLKAPLDVPASTVREAGTDAAAPLLVSVTVDPPVGAAPLSVTVPCSDVPPCIDVDPSVSDATLTVTVVDAVGAVGESFSPQPIATTQPKTTNVPSTRFAFK
jgi:hypothetical protein